MDNLSGKQMSDLSFLGGFWMKMVFLLENGCSSLMIGFHWSKCRKALFAEQCSV